MKTVLLTPKSDQIVKVLEDTQFVVALSGLKNQDTDANPDIVFSFEKEGVSAEILGLFCLKPDSRLKLTTTALPKLPHTSCITKIKGVLYSNTEASYIGKIIIKKMHRIHHHFLKTALWF